MGISRKRPRTEPPTTESPSNPQQAETKPEPPPSLATDGSSGSGQVEAGASTPRKDSKADGIPNREIRPSGSWYGTWPRKSTASTHVAKESILADKQSAVSPPATMGPVKAKRASVTRDGRPPSMNIGKSKETSDITMGGTLEAEQLAEQGQKAPEPSSTVEGKAKENDTAEEPKKSEEPPTAQQEQKKPESTERPATSSGWLGGWLRKHDAQPSSGAGAASLDQKQPEQAAASEAAEQPVEQVPVPVSSDDKPNTTDGKVEEGKATDGKPSSTSWFGLWTTAPPSTAGSPKKDAPAKEDANDPDTVMSDEPEKPPPEPAAGSSWAFWSADPNKKTMKPSEAGKVVGELAVVGEPSQNKPEPAKAVAVKEDKKKGNKRGRPLSAEVAPESPNVSGPETPATKGTPAQSPAPPKVVPPNLLMPSVKGTYSLVENPSILQQLARILLHSQQKPAKHVYLAKDRPKIKKALAIGVHGLFPAALLRTVIGQPTGTSIRFANHAAGAIRRWGDLNGCVDLDIEKVALEGEGKIAERVDNLWKLLLNWIDHIRKADFIMVACHSQGVPVSVMLVAKLIEFGVVSPSTRIAVCAMAGVSLGPFAEYRSRFTMFSPASSATELFEFAEPQSVVSKRYEESLRIAVKYGVRITYCGSIDDQVVSMESSIFSPVSHPYIYRAVFVDGRIHAPNFLSHLIGFALKLRNLGVSDHGLIRELSTALAGSLYTGEGHSRLYDDERVYDLAIEFALETTAIGDVPLDVQEYQVPTNANPYVLPWIMRGLLEEDFVKTELDAEVTELLRQFDEWKPTTKVLKDVKYRLEAVRSKL